jgi:predicted RNA-binding Zn-ribbon protein involved in translation (DUF1610 family)
MQQQCFFCGHQVSLIHVHGHYQCPVCGTNAMPCCDGDNCDTNLILKISTDTKSNPLQLGKEIEETGHPKNG